MRLSPEFIIVGEVRGPEAWELLNVWSTGHGTSVSTIHADTPAGALHRLGMLVRQAGVEPDQELIGSTVNLIATMERVGANHWRVREMVRCHGWDGQRYVLTPAAG
jgi:Flp pilus assembly CpaF family ATPase